MLLDITPLEEFYSHVSNCLIIRAFVECDEIDRLRKQ